MPNGSVDAGYRARVLDSELADLIGELPAIALEGPKGVGKTSTARRLAATVVQLDDPAAKAVIAAEPARLVRGDPPVLIDEWQRYPPAWDLVRRAVDDDGSPGRFLLTGSATPSDRPTHSGAGRIVAIRMRPMTLPERGITKPTVSLAELVTGSRPELIGESAAGLETYTRELLAGGFPALRRGGERAQRLALDGYLERIIDVDLPEVGSSVRRPETLRRWLRAYAAATATTTSYDRIRDAATAGEDEKPAKTTALAYREALERIWILEPLQAWAPTWNRLARLVLSPKHHLADPALAARLVGVDAAALLRGEGPGAVARDGTFLGGLFESLVTLTVRVFAQPAEARVLHLRTKSGDREIDLIVARADDKVLAIEVKLAAAIQDEDVRHLRWLRDQLGDSFLDGIVVTTGPTAYRRQDGIGVVPLALLGP